MKEREIKLADVIRLGASWPARPEEKALCREKLRALLSRLYAVSTELGGWIGQEHKLADFSDAEFDKVITQSMTDLDPKPMIDLGFWCSLQAANRARIHLHFGAWSSGNFLNIEGIPTSVLGDIGALRAIIVAIVETYDPRNLHIHSRLGSQRSAAKNLPFPFIDWMVYHADCAIPPEALPMVHSVERIGSGTLVILKPERLYLDRPEDLALVETVEPIIRSYFPPAPPQPTVPEHKPVQ